jgi:hypothetical protein
MSTNNFIYLTNKIIKPILIKISEDKNKKEKRFLRNISTYIQVAKPIWQNIKDLSSEERSAKIAAVCEDDILTALTVYKETKNAQNIYNLHIEKEIINESENVTIRRSARIAAKKAAANNDRIITEVLTNLHGMKYRY